MELEDEGRGAEWGGDGDFPLNPTLVLNASVQSARVREWQVLPGRTHPVMTGRGGAEGYLFTGVRVLPAKGRVEARGKFGRKKRGGKEEGEGDGKTDAGIEGNTQEAETKDVEMAEV